MEVANFRIRASYPNYFMVQLYAREGRSIFDHDSEDPENQLEGNKPGTVIYTLEGEGDGVRHEFPPRWYDMYRLLCLSGEPRKHFLEMLLDEQATGHTSQELTDMREAFRQECIDYVAAHPLTDGEYLITTLTPGDFTDEDISYKGRMLLDLTRNCYPVPDFCILTSKAFAHPELLPDLMEQAIANLETMTDCRLGSSRSPLVFAIRCAMPQYIPGLMPTMLNIGVTRNAYTALLSMHNASMANRVYLSTLHSIAKMLGVEHRYEDTDISLNEADQRKRIAELEHCISEKDERLLEDAHYQALRLIQHVRQFYIDNSDLILCFMQGKQAYPSFILQRMVWTIGNDGSYPGVLYSRHSRTGVGKQVESYRNIFGEEIMTGDVVTEDRAYSDRSEIRSEFPAVYHFDPLLKKLEYRYKTPVTIEFAVETLPHQLSLFSVLQLNASEMTGGAALISAIDLRNSGLIDDACVMDLIKPYHLRQILSASIDDQSIEKLELFSNGLSVLPRTSISARLCFSIGKCREYKKHGENVCLCKDRFCPEDTILLNEVDSILSISPAAIHVVTACRGYGIPAFMDLQTYGVRIVDSGERGVVSGVWKKALVNAQGLAIAEGEMISVSSERQSIFCGKAQFKPASFTEYMNGQQTGLSAQERSLFMQMRQAFAQYRSISESQKAENITNLPTLARLIRINLQNQPQKASGIVNAWYSAHISEYISGVLKSKMGDHNDQSRIFNHLTSDNKADFMRRAHAACRSRRLTGLTAGSFMLGRFIANPLPVAVWNSLSDLDVAFFLNEYVMYQKYIQVLQEVGEIKLARAHSRIETEGIDNMVIRNFDLATFIPLLKSQHDLQRIAEALENIEHQDNTHLLVAELSRPIDTFGWSDNYISEILTASEG